MTANNRHNHEVVAQTADYEVVSYPGYALQYELNLFDGELRYFATLAEAESFAVDFFSYQSFDVYD